MQSKGYHICLPLARTRITWNGTKSGTDRPRTVRHARERRHAGTKRPQLERAFSLWRFAETRAGLGSLARRQLRFRGSSSLVTECRGCAPARALVNAPIRCIVRFTLSHRLPASCRKDWRYHDLKLSRERVVHRMSRVAPRNCKLPSAFCRDCRHSISTKKLARDR